MTTAADGSGAVARYLAADHVRRDTLLARAADGAIDMDAFARFREGLLRHIGMEEKILLPAAQRARGGEPLPEAARLRLDHGALAALRVPTPTLAIIAALRAILARHNAVEEGADGVYAACEALAGADADALLAQLHAAPPVPVNRHVDGPLVENALRRALTRAGYDPVTLGL